MAKLIKLFYAVNLLLCISIVCREHNFSVLDHINQQRENFYPIYYKNQDPFKNPKKNYFNKIIKEKKKKTTRYSVSFQKKILNLRVILQ